MSSIVAKEPTKAKESNPDEWEVLIVGARKNVHAPRTETVFVENLSAPEPIPATDRLAIPSDFYAVAGEEGTKIGRPLGIEESARTAISEEPLTTQSLKLKDLADQWGSMVSSLKWMANKFDDPESPTPQSGKLNNWSIDEIDIGMAISAGGKLAFIVEGSMEASVHFVLRRK